MAGAALARRAAVGAIAITTIFAANILLAGYKKGRYGSSNIKNKMLKWLHSTLKSILPSPYPFSAEPRMPNTLEEAERVYRKWDNLNGRYYFVADIVFADGTSQKDVVFDGDSNIVVQINGRKIVEQPRFFGQPIIEFLVTDDKTAGRRYTVNQS